MGNLLVNKYNVHWAEYGARNGIPVFYCHAIPGSSVEPELSDSAAKALNIRLISIELPGFGQSDLISDFQLDDWPAILSQVADSLNIAEFSLLGFSGGGAFALACAHHLPNRVRQVSLVGCTASFDTKVMASNFPAASLQMYLSSVNDYSETVKQFEQLATSPEALAQIFLSGCSDEDLLLFSEPEIALNFNANCASILKQGVEGIVSNMRAIATPWHFDLKAITVPVTIWQGLKDHIVAPPIAHYLDENIAQSKLKEIEDKGHFLHFSLWESVLESTIK